MFSSSSFSSRSHLKVVDPFGVIFEQAERYRSDSILLHADSQFFQQRWLKMLCFLAYMFGIFAKLEAGVMCIHVWLLDFVPLVYMSVLCQCHIVLTASSVT